MILPVVQKAIEKAPRYVAGVSFSDRTIRYIEIESNDGILTLSSYGQQTIPYDTVAGGKVKDTVVFAETVKKLRTYLHSEALVVLKDDGDSVKAESFAVAGFKKVGFAKGLGILRGIYAPWGIELKRIALFANHDQAHVLEVSGNTVAKLGVLDSTTLLGERDPLAQFTKGLENKEILIAGGFGKPTYIHALHKHGHETKNVNIWQNLFDFTRYVPEVPQHNSYIYTMPAALVVQALMRDLPRYKTRKKKGDRVSDGNTFDLSENTSDLSNKLTGIGPMTKLHEDHRTKSEKELPKKYQELLDE